jgi:hypothetical protein
MKEMDKDCSGFFCDYFLDLGSLSEIALQALICGPLDCVIVI